MKKISILLLVVILLVSMVGCQAKAPAQTQSEPQASGESKPVEAPKLELKYAHVCAVDHPYNTAGLKLAELMAEKTNGQIVIKTYPAAQLGGERDLMEGMQIGSIDMVVTSLGVAASFVPETNILNLPFLFKDADHFVQVAEGPIGERLLAEFDKADMVGLGFAGPVFRVPMNNKRPLNTPADLKGLSIRLMEVPLHMDAYAQLGAKPTPIPLGELYTALQLGTVDGCENAIATLYSQRYDEVQKYMSILPVFSNGCAILMSKIAWEKMSPDQQQALLESMPEAIDVLNRDYLAMDKEGLDKMTAAGLKVNTPEDMTPFVEAMKPVYDKYLKDMPDWAKEAVAEIQKSAN